MVKWSVIIPAAGSGVRLGSDIPKPFIKISDKTILEHTIDKFVDALGLIQIIVATSKQSISLVSDIFKKYHDSNVFLEVVEGSEERQLSIENALAKVLNEAELIGIHDAVRPFVKTKQIEACCNIAYEYGGAVLGVPAKDTIKQVMSDFSIKSTPDRSLLWQAQTPQIFQKDLLLDAYKNASNSNFLGTDDASLVERIGGTIKMVEGERENLKITYPIDLKIAELIMGESNE